MNEERPAAPEPRQTPADVVAFAGLTQAGAALRERMDRVSRELG